MNNICHYHRGLLQRAAVKLSSDLCKCAGFCLIRSCSGCQSSLMWFLKSEVASGEGEQWKRWKGTSNSSAKNWRVKLQPQRRDGKRNGPAVSLDRVPEDTPRDRDAEEEEETGSCKKKYRIHRSCLMKNGKFLHVSQAFEHDPWQFRAIDRSVKLSVWYSLN